MPKTPMGGNSRESSDMDENLTEQRCVIRFKQKCIASNLYGYNDKGIFHPVVFSSHHHVDWSN